MTLFFVTKSVFASNTIDLAFDKERAQF
jgi:hypothetical protein